MFEKEAKEYVNEEYDFCYYPEDNLSTRINAERDWSKGAEFGYNKANEWLTLPKDILSLWQQTVCEIRSEIKNWDLKGPHVSDYAKVLCDKLARSMCAVAGAPYCMRYSITD